MSEIYYERILDETIEKRLKMVGAIVIEGPKWCGKTTTAKQHAKSIIQLQDPDNRQNYLELAEIMPSKLLEGETPRLIDEWQVAPVLWDAVRTKIDNTPGYGQFILTGSTSVDDNEIMHTGTGRVNRMTMLPMSLYESRESNGKISILELFKNPDMDIDGIESNLTMEDLAFATCRGGWPESIIQRIGKRNYLLLKTMWTIFANPIYLQLIKLKEIRNGLKKYYGLMLETILQKQQNKQS